MKASIIIPTYNRATLLFDSLRCVSQQDLPSEQYEIIIVDNGPQMSTEVQALSRENALPSIRYLHEPKNGPTNARHKGVKASTGEILVFIDDDILCEPQWLGKLLAPFEDPAISLVGGKVVLKFDEEPPAWIYQFKSQLSGLDLGDSPRPMKREESP